MYNIGKKLKNAIKNSNYSQKDIAKIIEKSEKVLSFYIQDKTPITAELFIKICEIIETPIQEVIYGIDNNNINEVLISKFNKLTEEQKDRILEQIEFYEHKNQMSYTSGNTRDVIPENHNTG